MCVNGPIVKMAELAKCTEIHRRLCADAVRDSSADVRLMEVDADSVRRVTISI